MYKKSIRDNSKYLIPFIQGVKYYGNDRIEHNLGTMMLINDDGDILTCKHIALEFINNIELNKKYGEIIKELDEAKNEKQIKKIEDKYKLNNNTVVLSNINLPFKVDGKIQIDIKVHKYLDLALIRFKGIQIKSDIYPIFSETLPEQGQSICKLGFAFPEYDFFEYSHKDKNIVMKKDIVANFPLFPLDGIVTRYIMDENKELSMFEMSTPGIGGQSGGPIFSPDGVVYGIQSMTKYMKLSLNLVDSNNKIDINPYISLGVGISSSEIISFLKESNVKFYKSGE